MTPRFSLLLLILFACQLLSAQSVTPTKSVYAPYEQIVVNYSGFQGTARDWIGIAAKGLADDKYTIWTYTDGRTSGTVTLQGLAYGEYEVRGYFDNGGVVKARSFIRVGNVDQNVSAKTQKPSYKPYEKIMVDYSGLPGNPRDWVSLAKEGSADDQYVSWFYTEGKPSGTFEFPGLAEGRYEVRTYFNNEGTVRSRYPFTVSNTTTRGNLCRNELSMFYAGMHSFGLSWGRLGSDQSYGPITISAVQATLGNVVAGINAIGCLDFQVSKIINFSSTLPGKPRQTAVNEIEALIKELQASVARARFTCDKGALLDQLFITGIHIGAAQAIANSFVCMAIPLDWQANVRNHLSLVTSGIQGFGPCIPGVNPSVVSTVDVGNPNAYIPVTTIMGIHQQILWNVSLSECCCGCG